MLSHFHLQMIHTLRVEMAGFFVGPMPVKQFLNNFLPEDKLKGCPMPSQFQQGCFNETIEAETELSAYSPFVSQTVVWTTYTIADFLRLSPDYHDPKIGSQAFIC
jgi:hypothetical protein